MTIRRANSEDLASIRRLLQKAERIYTDHGAEDLPALVAQALSFIGQDGDVDSRATGGLHRSNIWGFLAVQLEDRPPTLPGGAPTRAYVRDIALRSQRTSADALVQLMDAVVFAITHNRMLHATGVEHGTHQPNQPSTVQIIIYGGEHWLTRALASAGFDVTDRVQFFELKRPAHQLQSLSSIPQIATLSPANLSHLGVLTSLDAAAFPPLWHFGNTDMMELLIRCRVQIATLDETVIGYSALSVNSPAEAQLARLAVHPRWQRMGVGRQLLADAIRYAAAEKFSSLVLNTQTNNERSQYLYRSLGFRPIGLVVPVLARTVTLPYTNRDS